MLRKALLLGLTLALGACGEAKFTKPLVLAGKTVSADKLEQGRILYTRYCRQCHGDQGNGKGPAARGLMPPPRDFSRGEFKFAAVANGQLPNDADLKRIVKGGLEGTAMLPWDITDNELDSVIQYIKTFPPVDESGAPILDKDGQPKPSKWIKKDKTGDVIETSPDPWGPANQADAIARGKVVYHVKAMCASCHPYYATLEEVFNMSTAEAAADEGLTPIVRQLRPHAFLPELKESPAYGNILPPDFTFRAPRSGRRVTDIYRSIASGIGGTAMPKWKGILAEKDMWALAYYVKSLVDLKDTAEAAALHEHLEHAPAFTPPPPPPDPDQPAEAGDGADSATPPQP